MSINVDPEQNYKKDINYKKIGETSIHDMFHLNTELNKYNRYQFSDGIAEALSNKYFFNRCLNNNNQGSQHKDNNIKLISTDIENNNSGLFDILKKRRSIRNFSGEKVSLNELSNLLIYSAGITGKYEAQGPAKPETNLLSYPLAGGIECLDVYVSVRAVENLNNGLYYFDKYDNTLNFVNDKYDYDELTASKRLSPLSSFTIYIVGSMEYIGYKYGERGYRFMLLEAGHLAQNIYLSGTALNLGVVASGGYMDDEIKKAIGLENKYVLYEIFVGKINYDAKDIRFIE